MSMPRARALLRARATESARARRILGHNRHLSKWGRRARANSVAHAEEVRHAHTDRGLNRSNALRQGRQGSLLSNSTGDCDQPSRGTLERDGSYLLDGT